MTPSCPGDDTLIALVEHVLDPTRVAALADHVDGCERCRSTIGHLVAVDSKPKSSQVGRYHLEEQLGAGGMGVVWAAWDPKLERRVAIKLLRPEVGEHGPARLIREARALAQLQHPNVVAVHDVGEHDGEVFLATELVDGEPLDRWQRAHSTGEILDAYIQAARGLAAAHAMGLVHRDVKPSNILVARDGRVRVGDFGLARLGPGEAASPRGELGVADVLTREGDVVGTPAYMAPEQRAGKPVDGRADQYALCVALAEALGGKRPDPDAPADTLGAIDPQLARSLARGLRRDPLARFPDMNALAEALLIRPFRRSHIPLIGATLVVVGTATGIGFALNHNPVRPEVPSSRVVNPIQIDHLRSLDASAAKGSDAAVEIAVVTPDAPRVTSGGGMTKHRRSPGAGSAGGTAASPPAGAVASTAGLPAYVDAIGFVNNRDPACKPAFVRFDALGVARMAQMSARDDSLMRARCELLVGNCSAGERTITMLYTSEGLSTPAISDEVRRESTMNCSTRVGAWQDRLPRLVSQSALLQSASASTLTRELAAAEAVVHDAGGAMSRSQRNDLTTAVLYLAQGFSRLAGHCGDARRARALGDHDPMVMSDSLKQCLSGTGP